MLVYKTKLTEKKNRDLWRLGIFGIVGLQLLVASSFKYLLYSKICFLYAGLILSDESTRGRAGHRVSFMVALLGGLFADGEFGQ